MKQLFALFVMLVSVPAIAAPADVTHGRAGYNPRVSVPMTRKAAPAVSISYNATSSAHVEPDNAPVATVVDDRAKEREACLRNNIGVGNTFVWASRNSNLSNYASMTEDTTNPENNTCFVRVELKSADSRVNLSDIPAQYFEMGRNIACGSWTNEDAIEKRILDAKKNARVWGSVGASVAGAGVGVGAMELFGNKAIGGKVQGQKALSDDALIRSRLLTMKEKNDSNFSVYKTKVERLKVLCEEPIWGGQKPEECTKINYAEILNALNS